MGMTPNYTVGHWIGSKDRQSMGDGEYGGRTKHHRSARLGANRGGLDGPAEDFDFGPEIHFEPYGSDLVALQREAPAEAQAALPAFPQGNDGH